MQYDVPRINWAFGGVPDLHNIEIWRTEVMLRSASDWLQYYMHWRGDWVDYYFSGKLPLEYEESPPSIELVDTDTYFLEDYTKVSMGTIHALAKDLYENLLNMIRHDIMVEKIREILCKDHYLNTHKVHELVNKELEKRLFTDISKLPETSSWTNYYDDLIRYDRLPEFICDIYKYMTQRESFPPCYFNTTIKQGNSGVLVDTLGSAVDAELSIESTTYHNDEAGYVVYDSIKKDKSITNSRGHYGYGAYSYYMFGSLERRKYIERVSDIKRGVITNKISFKFNIPKDMEVENCCVAICGYKYIYKDYEISVSDEMAFFEVFKSSSTELTIYTDDTDFELTDSGKDFVDDSFYDNYACYYIPYVTGARPKDKKWITPL